MVNENFEQLMLLRDITHRTGTIHEAQVLQLKLWPRVLFGKSSEAETELEAEKKGDGRCIVNVTGYKGKKTQEKADLLLSWIKTLFGEKFMVLVKVNGKTYASSYGSTTSGTSNGRPAIK